MFKDLVSSYLKFFSKFYEGMITIFMLHRVSPLDPSKLFPNENMKISPEFVEKFIIAYPFGSKNEIGKRELDIVRSLGFKTATTTLHGTIYPEHRHYLNCLPRIFLTENFNIKNAYKIRKRRIVTL